MQLTKEQEEAIARADQDLVLIAGAGSGKTLVLTEICARLIEEFRVPPEQIVVITFTEKAAGELKERIARRLDKPRSFLDSCPIGTIHAFAASFLRRGTSELPPDFITWDDNRAGFERRRMVHKTLDALLEEPPLSLERLIAEYGWRRLQAQLVQHLNERWNLRVVSQGGDGVSDELWGFYHEIYKRVLNAYQEHKRFHGAVDFEDLEEEALRLLSDETVQRRWQERFRHILVDEYQDISPNQQSIIRSLHVPGQNRLIVVGDPHQSIYRFRGAAPELFDQFREEAKTRAVDEIGLMKNFRSTDLLIDTLNPLFAQLFGETFAPMEGVPVAKTAPAVDILALPKLRWLTERRHHEAEAVSQRIASAMAEGCRATDFAVLFRSRAAMSVYEEALSRKGIPFQSQGGRPLLECQEIIDHINVFRGLLRPENRIALTGVMRSPLGGLSNEDLYISQLSPKNCPAHVQSLSDDFQAWWSDLQLLRPHLTASEVAERVWLRVRARGYYEKGQERSNILQWMAFLQWMEETDPLSLEDILEIVEGMRADGARLTELMPAAEDDDHVQLMTVHAAKGLEFPVVILADLAATLPSPRDMILIDDKGDVGLRRLDPEVRGLKDQLIDSPEYIRVKEAIRAQDIEESKRLLYVACTRAQEQLILPLDRNKKEKSETWNKWLCEAFKTF